MSFLHSVSVFANPQTLLSAHPHYHLDHFFYLTLTLMLFKLSTSRDVFRVLCR